MSNSHPRPKWKWGEPKRKPSDGFRYQRPSKVLPFLLLIREKDRGSILEQTQARWLVEAINDVITDLRTGVHTFGLRDQMVHRLIRDANIILNSDQLGPENRRLELKRIARELGEVLISHNATSPSRRIHDELIQPLMGCPTKYRVRK